jgi:type II restriction/modification system DNA methylase subunit YeeA
VKQRVVAPSTGLDRTMLRSQIDATDRQIDALVYELYRLTNDEIKIVEQTTAQ